jgi:transketolase
LAADGIECTVLHMHTVKPLDTETLLTHAGGSDLVVTIEEHTLVGGLGSAVIDALVEAFPGAMPPVKRLGIPDEFAHHYGNQDQLMELYGLQPPEIAQSVRDGLRRGSA